MFIVFDIGGTKMRVALSSDLEKFGEPRVVSTPQHFEEAVALLKVTALELLQGGTPTAAAGGVPGTLDTSKEHLLHAPHLLLWEGKPLKQSFEEALGVPVYLENDAALVGLGEAHHGAGRGYNIVAYLTVSTGVGGARIEHGVIDGASRGFEPGHQVIDVDKTLVPEATSGTLEAYVSGSAVEKRTGKHPGEITDEHFWDAIARYLSVGVTNTMLHWSPDVLVLGGSMMVKKPGIDIEAVQHYLLSSSSSDAVFPPLKLAELGDFGGLYGALTYLKQQQKQP